MNFTSKKYDGSTGGYFMAENYFLFNNDSEFKNVTFKDINVQIIDKSTGNDLLEIPGGNGDDLLSCLLYTSIIICQPVPSFMRNQTNIRCR